MALRRIAIDTYRKSVTYLHRNCAIYRADGFQALSKVEVRANGRRILATVNVVDDQRSPLVHCTAKLPNDLRQKSLRLASRLIECNPDVRGGDGFAIARDILDSGRALTKMNTIIAAQGQKVFDHNSHQLDELTFEVVTSESGVVTAIDNLHIARLARLAGAPKVIGAGIDRLRKLTSTSGYFAHAQRSQ